MERKLIAAAVSSALVLPMAAQAVEFSVSGQVNRAIISVDGGGIKGDEDMYDGGLQHVDANSSNSKFRFTGSGELAGGMTAGVQAEWAALNGEDDGPTIRHANVYISSAGGKLTIGQGSTAANGMAHADLGGASWLGGATNWCSYAGTGPACPSNDGGRQQVLRYDTPAIGPASIAISVGNDDYWDAKVSVAGSVGDAGYDIRVGHIAKRDVTVDEIDGDAGNITTASAAVAFGQGTSVALAWSQDKTGGFSNDDIDVDHSYLYAKLDHSYGNGSIGVYTKSGSLDGGLGDDISSELAGLRVNIDGTLWGIGIGHNLGAGATAYAGYRRISADGSATLDETIKGEMNDIDLFVAGIRVTFN